jgi:hypothetical protein
MLTAVILTIIKRIGNSTGKDNIVISIWEFCPLEEISERKETLEPIPILARKSPKKKVDIIFTGWTVRRDKVTNSKIPRRKSNKLL